MLLLQILGGFGYLAQKLFLAIMERSVRSGELASSRRWRIASWVAYLIGLPPIVALLLMNRNWIAGLVELSGLPAMILGLVGAVRGGAQRAPRWLNLLALASAIIGLAVSLHDLGGLAHLTQWMELGLVLGFLVGTWMLANERTGGYPWYLLMHVSCGVLMAVQDLWIMVAQQVISAALVLWAYRTALSKRKH